MTAILNAVSSGYAARTILNQLIRKYPQHANKIELAVAAGYSAPSILQQLAGNESEDQPTYMTEHEKTLKGYSDTRKEHATTAVGLLGAAGAIGAGYMAYNARNQTQVFPAPRRQPPPQRPGQTIDITPRRPGGGGPQQLQAPQKQLGYHAQSPQPNRPQPQGRGPSPNTPVPQQQNQPPARNPEQSIAVIKNMKEDARIENAIRSAQDITSAAAIFRQIAPRGKIAVLEKMPGGIEQILEDYAGYMSRPPATREPQAQVPQVQQQSQPPQIQEKALQELQPQQLVQTQQAPQVQRHEVQEPETLEMPQQILRPSVDERVREVAFGGEQPRDLGKYKPGERAFSIPNYHYAGESKEDYDNRKILFDAVNKAAKAITQGKDFTDFPKSKDVTYSTAADVIRYLAGMPNPYNALLDEEEKQELSDALISEEYMSEGMRPSQGERNIYGAQMTPNLVWNLILAVEPKIATMKKPPSVKGYKQNAQGGMGTAEIRRFLTHNVYGALSGKSMSTGLADTIGKISQATSLLDAMIQAARAGSLRKMDEYMEKLMDMEYFREVMGEELDLLTPEEKERKESSHREDIKNAASIKAAETRKAKKKGSASG